MFTYIFSHFFNHALGNISYAAMETWLSYHIWWWRIPVVNFVLYAAATTHAGLGLWALYQRRHFRYTAAEITQLALGLSIPLLTSFDGFIAKYMGDGVLVYFGYPEAHEDAEWLASLGMSEYAERFIENKIDISVLRHLTDQDLKGIGIPLGHRRKLLAAISELTGAAPATPKPAAATEPKTQDSAERRQVTVMFSDLVGSTALSARMDPEDLREVISAYQKCVAETVRRFGGFVAKYMGDGVLVYFGYPQAHEDDAERAVRAGLELIAAVAGLKMRASLQTRVGIATGLVLAT
jgi:class 3 adenylate cyclase